MHPYDFHPTEKWNMFNPSPTEQSCTENKKTIFFHLTYWQMDQVNIQKWHMEKLLIFLRDTFSWCLPKQEWKSGEDLIWFHITCRVSPRRCKSSYSHQRLFICWGLSGLLCTITSAYQCLLTWAHSLLAGLQEQLQSPPGISRDSLCVISALTSW